MIDAPASGVLVYVLKRCYQYMFRGYSGCALREHARADARVVEGERNQLCTSNRPSANGLLRLRIPKNEVLNLNEVVQTHLRT
jgi:hypothetical protein